VRKRRKHLKVAEAEEQQLNALQEKLPEGYLVLKDVYLLTKVGRSRADYVIVSPFGIFALEYRQYYVYIRANEEISRWTYAPTFKGKPFVSPLYQSKIHLHCIKELIGEKENLKTYPMIAFPSIAEIEGENIAETSFVGLVPDVVSFIEEHSTEACLSAEEVHAIAELIKLNSEKVKEMENPEAAKEAPEEYKAFIPGDYAEDDDEDEDELEASEDSLEDGEGEAEASETTTAAPLQADRQEKSLEEVSESNDEQESKQ
jgi:hypothetical protein